MDASGDTGLTPNEAISFEHHDHLVDRGRAGGGTYSVFASWLNMVEIEIGVLRGQCLDRRIDDPKRLINEIAAWERQRNTAGARIKWMFTTDKARAKMGRAYPVTSKES